MSVCVCVCVCVCIDVCPEEGVGVHLSHGVLYVDRYCSVDGFVDLQDPQKFHYSSGNDVRTSHTYRPKMRFLLHTVYFHFTLLYLLTYIVNHRVAAALNNLGSGS